jgi:hypothetical protein
MSTNALRSSVLFTIADPPFNDPDADVVLCTADNVHFRVYKLLLSLASPVFKDMFRLPQPSRSEPGSTDESGRPIIPVAENRNTTEMMLRFCYPSTGSVTLDNFEDIQAVLAVMTKYDMQDGVARVQSQLADSDLVTEEPLRVFAISYRYRLADTARLAMKASIHHTLISGLDSSELDHIPASGLSQYLKYRTQCAVEIARVVRVSSPSSIWSSFPWKRYGRCGCSIVSIGSYDWRSWFHDCVRSITDALISRPYPEVLKPTLWDSSLRKACGLCYRAHSDVSEFVTKVLTPKVEKTISEVITISCYLPMLSDVPHRSHWISSSE